MMLQGRLCLFIALVTCVSVLAAATEDPERVCIPKEDLQDCQDSLHAAQNRFTNLQSEHQSNLAKLKDLSDVSNELKKISQEKTDLEYRYEEFLEYTRQKNEAKTDPESTFVPTHELMAQINKLQNEVNQLRAKKPLLMDWVTHTIEEVKNQDYQELASDSIESGSLYLSKGAMWLHATWNESSSVVKLEQFDGVKTFATKAYADHVGPRVVDPVLAHPEVKKHLPQLKKKFRRAKTAFLIKGSIALARARIARKSLQDKLKASGNKLLAKQANKLVDFGLGVALTPFVIFILYSAFYIVYLIVGAACCCFCCGACGRKKRLTSSSKGVPPPPKSNAGTKGKQQRKASAASKASKHKKKD